MNKNIIIAVVVVLLLLAGSFYGGIKYQQSHRSPVTGVFPGQRPSNNTRQGINSGGAVVGEVLSKDDTSITVKIPTGGSRIIFTSTSTPITHSVPGTLNDIAVGSSVIVQGTPNTDGSLTANSIQIRQAGLGTSTTPTFGR